MESKKTGLLKKVLKKGQISKILFPDRKVLVFFLLAFFVLISIFSAGFYLNDEMEQGTCFYNLLNGDLTIEEIPEHYYIAPSGIHYLPRYSEFGGNRYVGASHGMSFFSLPFYYFLWLMDWMMGIQVFFALLWSCLLASLIWLSSGYIARILNKKVNKKKRIDKRRVKIFGIALSIALLVINIFLMKSLDFDKWGPPISMQFMSIIFIAFGLTALLRLLRNHFNEKIAFFGATFLLVATPAAFWGMGQKYHGLNLALLMMAFASFYYGKKKGKDRYHYAGYIFACLAIWVQIFTGAIILISLFIVDILTTKKKKLLNVGKIVVVTTIALTPYFAENYLLYDEPLYPGYIVWKNVEVIPSSPPEIELLAPTDGEYITGEYEIRYKTSENADASIIEYKRDGRWIILKYTREHDVRYIWNTTNIDAKRVDLRIKAWNWKNEISCVYARGLTIGNTHQRAGLENSSMVGIKLVNEKTEETIVITKIRFILNSIDVGWKWFEANSIFGSLELLPKNLYKSFFDAEGTDSDLSFFTIAPFLFLSIFAPIAYIKKRQRFGMLDGLMLAYIIVHLIFYANLSTSQGGGYDVRRYLPLHIPFLYFALVATKSFIKKNFWDTMKAYIYSLIIILPVLILAIWITGNKGILNLMEISGTIGILLIILIATAFILRHLSWWKKMKEKYESFPSSDQLLSAFIGIGILFGTWLLVLMTIVYSRGLPNLNNGGAFTMIIPIIRVLQDALQNILI